MTVHSGLIAIIVTVILAPLVCASEKSAHVAFFEKKIRPILVERCYRCHSESAKKQRGGLLLDRQSGWLKGGDSGAAIVPGNVQESLLIKAIHFKDEDLSMPPGKKLDEEEIRLLETWVKLGAPSPKDPPASAFSKLGDQDYLFELGKKHWAFQPVRPVAPPTVKDKTRNQHPLDQFIVAALSEKKLTPSAAADPRTLIRRLSYDLTGLPPTPQQVDAFIAAANKDRPTAVRKLVEELLASPTYGEHIGRLWLDVARYADTDSFYRPDTKTPHYFPFAFTYRDYVIRSFNADKPYDRFIREQLAADLMPAEAKAPWTALGFLAVGPHANRNQQETLDDWIDVTTRGLMGMTAACARCHDHKYEPIPTEDYYALRGVFASTVRLHPLDEKNLPLVTDYKPNPRERNDYQKKRQVIANKIKNAGKKTKGGNKRSVAKAIKETELAELLLFHPGAPARAMIVKDRGRPVPSFVFIRGDASNRSDQVPRRFLQILDPEQKSFPGNSSGRLQLANKIVSKDNPLTARVFVNRVWGMLMGSHIVDTPSDFGLQGTPPTHPQLLDWLADDFMKHNWSVKHLVRTIVLSQTYQQNSGHRPEMAELDPTNKYLWRANRKRLSIEELRDSLLSAANELDRSAGGRAGKLWGKEYSKRRTIYGYINRFNLDPTLRTFDFPAPMATSDQRGQSIVPTQALFSMNGEIVIDQAASLTESPSFKSRKTDEDKITALYRAIYQRTPSLTEVNRIGSFVEAQQELLQTGNGQIRSPWPLVAQALLMSNEFQYVD